MLRLSNSLIDAMISVCQNQDLLQTAMNCIEFGQYVAQACWVKDSPLLQLPHFTPNEVKHCEKGKASQRATNIQEYRVIPDADKKGMADFTEEQKQDVYKTLAVIPDISVESQVFVDDDEDNQVYEGDLCTVKVTITRNNLKDGETAGLVHAPRFPYPKQEAWWVILGTKEGKIISIEKVANPNKVVEHQIKFLAPRQGQYEFDLYVKSNAYMGLDQKSSVSLTTLDASVLPEYKVHPDDAELDDEPTLFEEMLNANIEQDSDSEDEDDSDSDDEGEGPTSTAAKKKEELQKARKAAAGDDDSDDEVEEVYAD
jgi:translocation protein SEC63